jgi:acyl carrier protein
MITFIKNFHEILDDTEIDEIKQNTEFKNLDEWDSMTTLMLIAMVDEKYEKQINGKDIKESTTLEDLYIRIQSK